MTHSPTCSWCGRKPDLCERNQCLPNECKVELARWIDQHGRRWRSALREHWLRDGIELRYLRNAIGPSGLTNIALNQSLLRTATVQTVFRQDQRTHSDAQIGVES